MIRVIGGDLWQWDTGRSVRLDVAGATQAHFAAAESQRAMVVDVKDGVARVPSQVLCAGRAIAVWASDGSETLERAIFPVRPRAKPDGYIQTDDEVRTWEDVKQWVKDAIAASGKALEAGTATRLGPDDAPTVEIAGGRLNLGIPAGRPGTSVATGEGRPAIGGREGDLYIDEATGALYKYARNDKEED